MELISKWINVWVIKFYINKHKTLYYNKANLNRLHLFRYESNNLQIVEKVDYERDIRVIFKVNLK